MKKLRTKCGCFAASQQTGKSEEEPHEEQQKQQFRVQMGTD